MSKKVLIIDVGNTSTDFAVFKDGNLQEFKPGAFKIAEKTNCPIIICCMKGTINIHKNWPWKKTHVYMDILEVLQPSVWETKNTVEVSQYAQDLIQKDLIDNAQ